MKDPVSHDRLFHKIVRRIAIEAENFCLSTKARLESDGWHDVGNVYEITLLPLITYAKRICLAGFKPDWLIEVQGDLPLGSEWARIITDAAVKISRQYFLPMDVAADPILKDFWMQPYFPCRE